MIHLGISNHSLIYLQWKISVPRVEPKIVKTRQFKYYKVNNFKSDVAAHLNDETIWSNTADPNVCWEMWKARFFNVADLYAPPITKRVRSQHASWITYIIINKLSVDKNFWGK